MKLKKFIMLAVLANGLVVGMVFGSVKSLGVDSVGVASSGDSALSAALSAMSEAAEDYRSAGALAKIGLLEGKLAEVPEQYHGASLVHGAMLWEMGIIKSLYTLLITPKMKNDRLVADMSGWSLGNVLNNLFTLTGNFIAPARGSVKTATYLTPTLLGQIYKALLDGSINKFFDTSPFLPLLKVAHPVVEANALRAAAKKGLDGELLDRRVSQNVRQQLHELAINNDKLEAALRGCTSDNQMFANICASVIISFFWSKYVMGVGGVFVEQETAREKIYNFMLAAGMLSEPGDTTACKVLSSVVKAAGAASVGSRTEKMSDAVVVLEKKAIDRIEAIYKNDMPRPFGQGKATLLGGQVFTDCGESGLWILILSAFYNPKEQSFTIPASRGEGFYDDAMRTYVYTHPRLVDQESEEARNARAEIMSGRPQIAYAQKGYDLCCNFQNVMCMLAQLVPGVYDSMVTSCGCAKTPMPDRNLHIRGHFSSSPACAGKMLEAFAEAHDLFIYDFTNDDKEVSWQISRTDPLVATCCLYYNTNEKHMDCELQGEVEEDDEQIDDPILGCSDAISCVPGAPDLIEPLLFAAARMRYQHDALTAYVALRPHWPDGACSEIITNLAAWKILTDDGRKKIEECKVKYDVGFCEAASLGLVSACKFYRSSSSAETIKPAIVNTALKRAAGNGHLSVVRYLCEEFPVNVCARGRFSGKTAFLCAVEKGYLDIVRYLYKKNSTVLNVPDTKGKTPLMYAAAAGFTRTVEFLCAKKASVDATDEDGTTALMYAAMEGRRAVVNFLCDKQRADVNAAETGGMTAILYAAEEGCLEIVEDLMRYGANIDQITTDGENAFDLAQKAGHGDVADFIRSRLMSRESRMRK